MQLGLSMRGGFHLPLQLGLSIIGGSHLPQPTSSQAGLAGWVRKINRSTALWQCGCNTRKHVFVSVTIVIPNYCIIWQYVCTQIVDCLIIWLYEFVTMYRLQQVQYLSRQSNVIFLQLPHSTAIVPPRKFHSLLKKYYITLLCFQGPHSLTNMTIANSTPEVYAIGTLSWCYKFTTKKFHPLTIFSS